MLDLVTIVLPTYNRAYCLPNTMACLIGQTYPRLEIIVVDDGSTDETPQLIAKYCSLDPRIIYIRQNNGGVSSARNAGLKAASGEFIAFCDSDDLWEPWKIWTQVASMQKFADAGLCWTDLSATAPDGQILHEKYTRVCYQAWNSFATEDVFKASNRLAEVSAELPDEVKDQFAHCGDIFSVMIIGTIVNMPTVMIRRSIINKVGYFNESMSVGEDYDFNLRVCQIAPAVFINVVSAKYRIGADDQLTRPELMIEQARNSLRTILPYVEQSRERIALTKDEISTIVAHKYRWLGESEFEAGNYRDARNALFFSIKYKRRQPRIVGLLFATILPAPIIHLLRKSVAWAKQHRRNTRSQATRQVA